MDDLIVIEFNVAVTGENSNEKTLEILNDNGIEIVDHYANGDMWEFECRTDSREKYYVVTDALDEEGIDAFVHE